MSIDGTQTHQCAHNASALHVFQVFVREYTSAQKRHVTFKNLSRILNSNVLILYN